MGFLRWIGNIIVIIFTGGKYGSSVRSRPAYRQAGASGDYAKHQEQRAKDFAQFGGHPCKICNKRIPGNKTYCGACFSKYVKK